MTFEWVRFAVVFWVDAVQGRISEKNCMPLMRLGLWVIDRLLEAGTTSSQIRS